MKIYCPKCRWEPRAGDLWICQPGCNHEWNTFDTGGRCPKCGKVWLETDCLACSRTSKHHDWYHDLPPVDMELLVEDHSTGDLQTSGR